MLTRAGQQAEQRWERLEKLFARLIACNPDERQGMLEAETPDDPALRAELSSLIADALDKHTGPLSRAVGAALLDVIDDQRRRLLGRVVGNYRVTSILGQGGTGTVYLAERADDQYSAQVAIKVIDQPLLGGNLSARFRAERQILASFNHPNIARLLDAGEMDTAQP